MSFPRYTRLDSLRRNLLDVCLLALSVGAMATSIFVSIYGPLSTNVDSSKGSFRQANDPEVLDAWQKLWWSALGAWSLWILAVSFHYLVLFRAYSSESTNVILLGGHILTIYFATMATWTVAYDPNTDWIKHNPLAQHSLCTSVQNTRYDGKLLVNFEYNYDNGFVVSPGVAMRRVAQNNQAFEVVHLPDPVAYARGQAWFYAMTGTGVYARFNNIATFGSHDQVAREFGYSCESYECPKGLRFAFAEAARRGFDAVQITHHMDQICDNIFVEIVAIGQDVDGRSVCPVPFSNTSEPNKPACPCNKTLSVSNCGRALNTARRPTLAADGKNQLAVLSLSIIILIGVNAFIIYRVYY